MVRVFGYFMRVRTRFAPSPTGYLHIGGVRTALFNWLFARHHGGQFIVRIDDTDRQRNIEATLQPILDGFRWLGLDWDEGPDVDGPFAPYFQSARRTRYQEAVTELLARGLAYHDYATSEEIQAERERAQKESRRFIYSRRWMAETPSQRDTFRADGRSDVVRLKMPRNGRCEFDDLIRGHVSVEWVLEQDHIIQRVDGTCLYHLASTVDDHDFEITHVIRAVEHLSNTPRHIFIAQGLGYDLPHYAHLPHVAEPGSGEKLSKRKLDKYMRNHEFKKLYDHGASIMSALGIETAVETFNPVVVDFYRQVGYRPEALLNYLLLLGWSLDDKTESFTRDEMIRAFTLKRVNKSAASFDPPKLLAFEERHMQALSSKAKAELVMPYLQRVGLIGDPPSDRERVRVVEVVEAAGDRIKVAGDVLSYTEFLQNDDAFPYDTEAVKKRLGAEGATDYLEAFGKALETVGAFDATTLELLARGFVEARGIAIGQIVHALRVAVTGKAVGFGLFDAMAILGRESCLARIDRARALVSAGCGKD